MHTLIHLHLSIFINTSLTNTLPPNRRLQRSIIANADNYIVADGLLFKITADLQDQTNDSQMFTCHT